MVLREVDIKNVSDPLMPHEVQCDVACLMYDVSSPKSFEYIARIYIVSHCKTPKQPSYHFFAPRNTLQKVKFPF